MHGLANHGHAGPLFLSKFGVGDGALQIKPDTDENFSFAIHRCQRGPYEPLSFIGV